MTRTVIVEGGSPVLHDPTTQVLHRYTNGEVLVETSVAETSGTTGVPVSSGVVLEGSDVETARNTLDRVGDTDRIAAYVELRGPPDAGMLDQLKQAGVAPQQFVPESTYLSTGTGAAFRSTKDLPFVQDVIPV